MRRTEQYTIDATVTNAATNAATRLWTLQSAFQLNRIAPQPRSHDDSHSHHSSSAIPSITLSLPSQAQPEPQRPPNSAKVPTTRPSLSPATHSPPPAHDIRSNLARHPKPKKRCYSLRPRARHPNDWPWWPRRHLPSPHIKHGPTPPRAPRPAQRRRRHRGLAGLCFPSPLRALPCGRRIRWPSPPAKQVFDRCPCPFSLSTFLNCFHLILARLVLAPSLTLSPPRVPVDPFRLGIASWPRLLVPSGTL